MNYETDNQESSKRKKLTYKENNQAGKEIMLTGTRNIIIAPEKYLNIKIYDNIKS